MSFFGNLLGGTLQGVGAGMSAVAADEERLDRERALIRERSLAAQELQQQRAQDRLYQAEQMAQMKADLGGGSGGGGKGINLAQMAMQARTPEDQDRVIRLANTFGGQDTGRLMADQMFNRPAMTGVAPTAGDFARYDRGGDMEAAPPATTLERAAYDADKGRQALQRAYTMFLDPGKLDDHAKAERQFGLNDFGEAVASKTMRRGGSLEDAASGFSKYSAPKDETGREELAQQRIEATRERTAATVANAGANRQAQDARALDRQIADAYKELNKARPKDKATIQDRIEKLELRRDGGQADGGENDYRPTSTTKATSPTSTLPKPRSPAEAARAYQYNPGSFTLR